MIPSQSLSVCVGLLVLGLVGACGDQESQAVRPTGEVLTVDGRAYFLPTAGMVPDSLTAARVAEAILIPIYGKAVVNAQRPFVARLADSVWIVEGYIPPDRIGGVATVEIGRRDGRIIRVIHGQ